MKIWLCKFNNSLELFALLWGETYILAQAVDAVEYFFDVNTQPIRIGSKVVYQNDAHPCIFLSRFWIHH